MNDTAEQHFDPFTESIGVPVTNIKRSELKKARDKYRSEKDPDAKARLADDIKALEKELGSKAEAEPVLDAKRKADLKAKYGL